MLCIIINWCWRSNAFLYQRNVCLSFLNVLFITFWLSHVTDFSLSTHAHISWIHPLYLGLLQKATWAMIFFASHNSKIHFRPNVDVVRLIGGVHGRREFPLWQLRLVPVMRCWTCRKVCNTRIPNLVCAFNSCCLKCIFHIYFLEIATRDSIVKLMSHDCRFNPRLRL